MVKPTVSKLGLKNFFLAFLKTSFKDSINQMDFDAISFKQPFLPNNHEGLISGRFDC